MYRYFMNPFQSVSTGNFKRMLLMARDHRDKLLQYVADPDIQLLSQDFNPIFQAFETAYSVVNDNVAFYRGNTQIVESLLQELSSTKIRQWDIWIQNVYLDNTPQYAMLLPHGRRAFQGGAYELRIDAIRTLDLSLDRFLPDLANVKADVHTFLAQIDTARTQQQQVETLDQSLRQELENKRIRLALEMHRVLGFLLYKHYQKPEEISRYYELKYLQASSSPHRDPLVSHVISANSRITLFNGQLTANSFITFHNTGSVPIKVFTSSDSNAVLPIDYTEILPTETHTFYANEPSDGNGFNWLIVVNDASQDAKCETGVEEIEVS